jgi:sialidase-1
MVGLISSGLRLVVFLLAIAPLAFRGSGAEPVSPALVDVFANGQDGYPAYRIPALITTKRGTLLAFAEGRASLRDHAENDIVLKRSTDNGRTWGPLRLVDEDATNALNNPTAVVVRGTGRVILMYQRYAKGFDEHNAEPGNDGPHICRTFIKHSDDDGVTWSKRVDVTSQVKRPLEVTSTATGPGIGIQLTRGKYAGRILMPFNQGPYGRWQVYTVFSDDGGKSWRYGETAKEGTRGYANEVQFAELNDGSVMLNARNQGGDKLRKIAISRDGGETWSPTHTDATLIEPVCQASLLRVPDERDPAKGILLFSNPASQTARTNGTIRLSRDEGRTWPVSRVLYPVKFGYSCLTSLANGAIGCLFEREGYISFVSFTIGWVEEEARE